MGYAQTAAVPYGFVFKQSIAHAFVVVRLLPVAYTIKYRLHFDLDFISGGPAAKWTFFEPPGGLN